MRRRMNIGTVLICIGGVFIISAVFLFAYNSYDSYRAGQAADDVLTELTQQIQNTEPELTKAEPAKDENEETQEAELTASIGDYDYMGYLSIPALNMNLPVMTEATTEGLKIAPGVDYGSLATDDLVICGHNYKRHFGPIRNLTPGCEVTITDMNGIVWGYQVTKVEVIAGTQGGAMYAQTEEDDWDLTLYTCTLDSASRYTVRCVRK